MGEESEDNQLPSDEEAVISDEEEERGSSAEEGGSDEEEDEDEDDEEGSDEEGSGSDASPSARRRPEKKSRPFVAPPPRALPQRTTRGARMGNTVAEEGDEEFWNQEFFADEENDKRYETESEPEDRFDADFNEMEDEGDEEEEAAEAEKEALAKEKKKKVLKPPGYKKPPLPKPRVKTEEGGAAGGSAGPATGAGAPRKRKSSIGPEDFAIGRRTVRESTRQKVEEGEMERKLAEKSKPRRAAPRSSNYRPLTQAELLAEAAKTEIENTKSLELLVLIEEETKKKAQVVKRRYAGPMVRWKSRRLGDREATTLEVRNMSMPESLQRRVAPAPPPPAVCAVTGAPARYRDPATGLPYASLEAYRELKRQREAGLLPVLAAGAPPGALQMPAAAAAAGQQAGMASPAAGTRYSTRQASQQTASPQQFAQLGQQQQPLHQPELLFQQQPYGGGLPAGQSPLGFFPQQHQQQAHAQALGFGGIT
ncbi:hypothetical protein ABPG75_005512 [Micractinium tetrahymenae]